MRRCLSIFTLIGSLCLTLTSGVLALAAEAPPALKFNGQGKFRIVQFTDTHWNGQADVCRRTEEVIDRVLDAEKPDLAVLTGDIVTVSRAPQEGWKSITEPIIRRKIPWAAALGNHDDENHGVSRRELVKFLAGLPYSRMEEGPESLGGTGNYILSIAGSTSDKPAAAIYLLDSRAYPKSKVIRDRCQGIAAKYGWISFDQIQWYRQSSRELRAANQGRPLPALALFHIPLCEYAHPLLKIAVGTHKEDVCCGAVNTGMFAAMSEEGDVMGVFTGHDHDNDYAAELFGICLAYGRCSGFGGYGSLPRGARVIELSEGQREFESWIRTDDGRVTDRFRYPEAFQ